LPFVHLYLLTLSVRRAIAIVSGSFASFTGAWIEPSCAWATRACASTHPPLRKRDRDYPKSSLSTGCERRDRPHSPMVAPARLAWLDAPGTAESLLRWLKRPNAVTVMTIGFPAHGRGLRLVCISWRQIP